MAQRTVVSLVDDLDGTEANETVEYALDGVTYEMDLNDENAKQLREVFGPYISAARRGTWAAIKLAQVGFAPPPDDPADAVLTGDRSGPDSTSIG